MALFQKAVIKKYLNNQDLGYIYKQWLLFQSHFSDKGIQKNIRNSKEEQYQEGFLRDLFVKILGYTLNPEIRYNLTTEYKNIKDSKKADAAILLNNKEQKTVIAVIELKGTDTTDLGKIEQQAFSYKNNQNNCRYVITSNFEKIRFYIDNAIEFIEFNLFAITEEQFQLLYLLLAYQNISKDVPKLLKEESVSNEETITKQLYKDYSNFKSAIYNNLITNNPQYDNLTIYKKTQKLLDRFLFIFFAEDRALLPVNFIFRINKEWQQLKAMRIEVSLYDRYKIYFNDLNIGAKVTLPAFNETLSSYKEEFQIFAYNGGLFQNDEVLDNIKIDDDILFEHTQKLSNYDFESEIDVNILGHIFENSLNEIDEIKAEIEGQKIDKSKTKRKKDGVFYTPKYITKYIVENTIGKLCNEKKVEIELIEEEYNSENKINKNQKSALIEKLDNYRNWLIELKICDPACGSGAFLNEALNYLIAEHRYLDELKHKLLGGGFVLSEIEMSILENNLFGVDINEESVEIAKLSLWLRTARPNRKLNSLSDNIKCGNSLIDDPEIAGDKAFNWEKEFPQVFVDKSKNIGSRPNASEEDTYLDATGFDPLSYSTYHITWATHNSRVSERMIQYEYVIKLRREIKGEPVIKPPRILTLKEEIFITTSIKQIIEKYDYNVIGFNICGDHVHIVVVCNESEIPNIVKAVKSITSRELNIFNGNTINGFNNFKNFGSRPNASENALVDATGFDPLSYKEKSITQTHLWQTKYSTSIIKNQEELYNVLHYVENNRLKHELDDNVELKAIIKSFLISFKDAFKNNNHKPKYKGGFDVVIGNPPYVRADTDDPAFIKQRKGIEISGKYVTLYEKWDLMVPFYERSINLLKSNGLHGFIVSNSIATSKYAFKLQKWILENKNLISIDFYDEIEVFKGVGVIPLLTIIENAKPEFKIQKHIHIKQLENIKDVSTTYLIGDQDKEIKVFKKEYTKNTLKINFTNLSDICYISVGMVLNADEFSAKGEFSKDDLISNQKGEIHNTEFVEGKDLDFYKFKNIKYLEYNTERVPNKIRRPTFRELYIGPKLLRGSVTPATFDNKTTLCNHGVIVFKRFIELKGITNNSITNSVTKNNNVKREDLELISSNFNLKYILSILNSKYAFYLLNNSRRHRLENYFYPDDFRNLPIPNISLSRSYEKNIGSRPNASEEIASEEITSEEIVSEEIASEEITSEEITSEEITSEEIASEEIVSEEIASMDAMGLDPLSSSSFVQEDFISKADIMLDKNKELQNITQKLIGNIKREFVLEDLSTKLNKWYNLTYAEFIKELEKKKIKLTLSQKAEWEDYFNIEKQKATEIKTIINQTDREIDLMVYKLYELTEEEIKIVDGE